MTDFPSDFMEEHDEGGPYAIGPLSSDDGEFPVTVWLPDAEDRDAMVSELARRLNTWPELLRALEALMSSIEDSTGGEVCEWPEYEDARRAVAKARAGRQG